MFLLSLCLMMCANNQIQYDPLAVFVCLQITLSYHYHYADVSEGTERLKFLYSVKCVCLRLYRFSQLSFMKYMGLYVFNSSNPLMMIVRIPVLYLIIIIKSEVCPICHLFRVSIRS